MAYLDEIIIASGVTSTGLVAGPEAEGGSASAITVESGGELAGGTVLAGGEIHGTYGAKLTDVSAETGAVIDLAYGATGKPATSGMTLRGADTGIAEGTLRYSGTAVNGYAANGVLYNVNGTAEWRFCIGAGLTVSGATLTKGARIYTEENAVIQTADILESGNIGLGREAFGYDITAGATGVARGKATLQIFDDAKAYRTLVSQGGQANIRDRAYAEDMTVFSDGKLTISNSGVASALRVSSGGEVYVYGGLVSGAELVKGAKMYTYGGVVSEAAINSGADVYLSAGVLSGGYISSGAAVRVYDGAKVSGARILGATAFATTLQVSNGGIADDVVISGARLYVYSGGVANRGVVARAGVGINVNAYGTANYTSLTVANGFQNVNANGVAYYTVGLGGGEVISEGGLSVSATFTAGYQSIRSTGVARDTRMNGGTMYVSNGGVASNALINKNATVTVSNGGVANLAFNPWMGTIDSKTGATINYLAHQDEIYIGNATDGLVAQGAEFTGYTINKNDSAVIFGGNMYDVRLNSGGSITMSGGLLSGGYISSGAYAGIWSGALVSGARILGGINYDATLQIREGGSARDVAISGGRMNVYAGGVAERTSVDVAGVGINVSANGTVRDTVMNKGFLAVLQDGVAERTLGKGGYEAISKGGLSISATYTAGSQVIRTGGKSLDAVMNGGSMLISNGGVASNASINRYGSAFVSNGGKLVGGHVSSGGFVYVSSGGVVSGIKVLNGTNYAATLQVSGGGLAKNIVISGTRVIVWNGGSAQGTVVDRTGVGINLSKGASARNTVLKAGWQIIYDSAVGEHTVIKGGSETMYTGGKSISATVLAGALNVSNGGLSLDAVVNGGEMRVSSGGSASGAVINTNGKLIVYSTGKADVAFNPWMGTITSNTGATVNYLGRDREIYLAEAHGLVSRADAFDKLEIVNGGSAIAWGGTVGSATVYAGGSMIASGAVQLGDLTVGGRATFSQNVGATIGDVKVLNGGIVATESGGVGRVNSIEIRSGGQFQLRIGTDLSVGDVTVSAGGSFGINNYAAAASISGALVLDLSGAKGNTGRYMVYSSFNNVHGSRIVKASEEIGNYTYKLVSKGGDNSAAYNFTLDASGNRYTLARGGSVVNPLAKMTYTAGSSAYSGGADIRLTTVVDGAYTITAVDTAAALATKGEAVNTNDKMARWTENTTATSAVNLADGMTTGNAWLEIDGLAFDKALYGTAENQNFAGAVNVKLTSGSIRNLAAGAAKGGTVRAANFTMAGGTLAGAGYAGGFGNVTDEVNTTITAGTLASGKDFYAGALANYAKTGIATTVGNVSLTVKGGEFGGNLYGASAVKASVANAHTAGNVTLKLIDGNTAKADFCCFAGGYATGSAADATVYTVGSVTADISGGSWGTAAGGRGLFGGAFASGVGAQAGNVTVSVTGGSFGNVFGGGWAQKGGTSIVDDVNLTISGGTITNVFGGGSHSTSGGTTETGDITITVSGGNITGDIYARGQLDGDTTGAASVIFTGANDFDCGVFGYSYVGGAASDAALSFSTYTGEFSGNIGGFNDITFDGATAMTLATDATDVSNSEWKFDVSARAEALAGTALLDWDAADFAGDTIKLNLADGDGAAWTLVSGAAATEYGEFDVLVDGSSILDAALALDEKIVGGVWDGWGFTVEDAALKFKQLA